MQLEYVASRPRCQADMLVHATIASEHICLIFVFLPGVVDILNDLMTLDTSCVAVHGVCRKGIAPWRSLPWESSELPAISSMGLHRSTGMWAVTSQTIYNLAIALGTALLTIVAAVLICNSLEQVVLLLATVVEARQWMCSSTRTPQVRL